MEKYESRKAQNSHLTDLILPATITKKDEIRKTGQSFEFDFRSKFSLEV